jgi:hypothetical protein
MEDIENFYMNTILKNEINGWRQADLISRQDIRDFENNTNIHFCTKANRLERLSVS